MINNRDWLYEELMDSCSDLIRLDMKCVDEEEWNKELDSLMSFIRFHRKKGILSEEESDSLLGILGEIY